MTAPTLTADELRWLANRVSERSGISDHGRECAKSLHDSADRYAGVPALVAALVETLRMMPPGRIPSEDVDQYIRETICAALASVKS